MSEIEDSKKRQKIDKMIRKMRKYELERWRAAPKSGLRQGPQLLPGPCQMTRRALLASSKARKSNTGSAAS